MQDCLPRVKDLRRSSIVPEMVFKSVHRLSPSESFDKRLVAKIKQTHDYALENILTESIYCQTEIETYCATVSLASTTSVLVASHTIRPY